MKSALVVFGLLTMAMVANAETNPLPKPSSLPVELCQLEAEDGSEVAYEEVESLDIKKITSLTEFQLNLVNQHLLEREYTSKALSFAEIKALFSKGGQEEYNDLSIITMKFKTTGKLYVEVKSYPGDNPYGLIFEAQTGKLVAMNGDDSIYLFTQHGDQVSCYDLSKYLLNAIQANLAGHLVSP